jgi:hypothetical protein
VVLLLLLLLLLLLVLCEGRRGSQRHKLDLVDALEDARREDGRGV